MYILLIKSLFTSFSKTIHKYQQYLIIDYNMYIIYMYNTKVEIHTETQ